jgi:hypothetical protein
VIVLFSGEQNFQIPKGQKMKVKLGNDEIVDIINTTKVNSKTNLNNANQITTTYQRNYSVISEQASKMSEFGIAVVSIGLKNQKFTIEFKDKVIEKNKFIEVGPTLPHDCIVWSD